MNPEQVEDIYELSPLQQGILFHCLFAPESGVYFEQDTYPLVGDLDIPSFVRAWQDVVDRHAMLRTSFHWEGIEKPVQVVRTRAELPVHVEDWTALSRRERRSRLDAYLEADRVKGFELSTAPLLRLALFVEDAERVQLVLSFHHLLLDGWSNRLLVDEVWTIYEAHCGGVPAQLADVRPYGDFIAWLQRQDLSKAEGFWRRTLKGFTTPTRLGIEHPAGSHLFGAEDRGELELTLSARTSEALQRFSRENRVTLNTLVQGAWAVILSRYSGEEDVVFGTVVSGRPATLEGVESMVGLFINTLPLRAQVTPHASVRSWLKQLQSQQSAAREYEYSPLVEIHRWSDVPPGLSLFDTIVIFENYPVSHELSGHEQEAEPDAAWRSFELTNYDINLVVVPGGRLSFKLIYNKSRFGMAAIQRLLGHIHTILEALLNMPYARLGELDVLNPRERRQILRHWNSTHAQYSLNAYAHQLVEEQVIRTPDALAIASDHERATYAQLNARANHLSHRLGSLGVGPGSIVGVLIGRSVNLAVSLLGVLKTGAAYLPLDPMYPAERLEFMLADSRACVLVTDHSLDTPIPPVACATVRLESDSSAMLDAAADGPVIALQPEDIAYVIYTSGSTGTPKAVQICHRGLTNLIRWHQQAYGVTSSDRATQVASVAFDASVWELWPYLTVGASVHLPPTDTTLDVWQLIDWLISRGITLSFLPTPLAEIAIQQPWPDECALRFMLTGGDVLRNAPRQPLPFTLVNHYGPTENTVVSTAFAVSPGQPSDAAPPIGFPISNTTAYVLDSRRQPVPIGAVGELFVGGVQVAAGYLNRPELTAEKFLPDPFDPKPGARLYRTGDLARYRQDGAIEFLGRRDDQVKVNGFRIEPAEIELTLLQHPAIREAVVIAREDEHGDKRLIAYLVGAGLSNSSADDLRQYLHGRLPAHMVPGAFIVLNALPHTPAGKIDRRSLPDHSHAGRRQDEESDRALSPLERVLVNMYANVLSVDHTNVNDNFFADLGGHSLLATRLVSRIRDSFDIDLPLRVVFDHPTVRELTHELLKDSARAPFLARKAELLLTLAEYSDEEIEARLVADGLSSR